MFFNNLKSIAKLSAPCLLHILFIQMIFSLFKFWALHNVMFIIGCINDCTVIRMERAAKSKRNLCINQKQQFLLENLASELNWNLWSWFRPKNKLGYLDPPPLKLRI